MAQKEYKIIYDYSATDTEGEMNKLAADGWYLKAAIGGYSFVADGDHSNYVAQFIMERDRPEAERVSS